LRRSVQDVGVKDVGVKHVLLGLDHPVEFADWTPVVTVRNQA
jgi:hypothetical protein